MEADNDRLDSKNTGAVVLDLDKARAARDSAAFSTTSKKAIDPVKRAAMQFWLLLFVAIVLILMVRRGRNS